MNSATIQKAAAAVRKIDFDAIAAEVARIKTDIADCEAAINRAHDRQALLEAEIQAAKTVVIEDVADGLLNGDPHAAKRADIEAMQDERLNLGRAVGELKRRIETLHQKMRKARDAALIEAAPLFDDLATEYEREANEAFTVFAKIYANAKVICGVARSEAMFNVVRNVGPGLAHLGRISPDVSGPIPAGDELQPIRDAFAEFTDKGAPSLAKLASPPERT